MRLLRKDAEAAMDQACLAEIPPPWERECPMNRELLMNTGPNGKARFHLIDPWHTIHLGVGKVWVGCGVMLLQDLLPQSTLDQRISFIGTAYKTYCRQHKLNAILRKIDVHTFAGTKDPIGTWHKASITSNWMMFLESYCDQIDLPNERLRVFVS